MGAYFVSGVQLAAFHLTPLLDYWGTHWEELSDNDSSSFQDAGKYALFDVRAADGFFSVADNCPPDAGVPAEPGSAVGRERHRHTSFGEPADLYNALAR